MNTETSFPDTQRYPATPIIRVQRHSENLIFAYFHMQDQALPSITLHGFRSFKRTPTDSPDQDRSIGDKSRSKNMRRPQRRGAPSEISLAIVDEKEDCLIRSHSEHLKRTSSTSEISPIDNPDQGLSIGDKS